MSSFIQQYLKSVKVSYRFLADKLSGSNSCLHLPLPLNALYNYSCVYGIFVLYFLIVLKIKKMHGQVLASEQLQENHQQQTMTILKQSAVIWFSLVITVTCEAFFKQIESYVIF